MNAIIKPQFMVVVSVAAVFLVFLSAGLVPEQAVPHVMAQDSARVVIEPGFEKIVIGEQLVVQVQIKEAADLGGYQFVVQYQADMLELVEHSNGDFLGSTGRDVRHLPAREEAGKLTLGAISLGDDEGASGDGVLVELTFDTLQLGRAEISLSDVKLTSAAENEASSPDTSNGQFIIEELRYYAMLPMLARQQDLNFLPEEVVVTPGPTEPPTDVPTVAPTEAEPTPTLVPTATETPDPSKEGPYISEMQCNGRHEWVAIENRGSSSFDLDGYSIRSKTGGDSYRIRGATDVRPGEVWKLHSGSGSPSEDRLNKVWSATSTKWAETRGDAAMLYSPRPNPVLLQEAPCVQPTP